jgi:multidrug efflux pump subunit AcrA (membrane-fusion protein)
MAYSDYAPYKDAFKRKNDLDFKLRSPLGLANQMASARTKYGVNSKEYKAAKEKFDATDKQYKAAVSALARIKAKIDSDTAKEKADAAKAKSVTGAKSEIATLEMQIAAAREQNKPAFEVKALQDRLDVLRGVVSGTPPVKPPPAGAPATSLSEWDNYTVNTMKGTVTAPGGNPVYFANVKGTDGKPAIQGFTSMSQARTAFLQDYTTEAQLTKLKSQLVKSGYLKPNQVNTTEWLGSVDTMLAEYTYKTMIAYKYEGVKTPALISSWLPTRTSGTGSISQAGTDTTPYTSLSTRLETNREADKFFQDWLTRPATPEEKDAYFAAVNKAESLAVSKRTTTTDAKGDVTKVVSEGGFLTEGDRLLIAVKIAKPSLANINIDSLLAGGGKLAQNINDLQAYAATMGLPKSSGYYLTAAENMLTPDGLTVEKEKIKRQAELMFKPLTGHIQAGGTVKDVIDTYAEYKSRILELPQLNIKDPSEDKDIFEAISGPSLMSLGDFQKKMYQDPRYGKTKAAHETAADYASTVLRAFGLMT